MTAFSLPAPQPDPLLELISRYRADKREDKIDLGVGMYRDTKGNTPVLNVVKEAEQQLHDSQDSKSYLGLTGDIGYVDAYAKLIFGQTTQTVTGAQTPGGSGALRLAAEVFKTANPNATLWIGVPTWPNHLPLTESAGVRTKTYQYFSQQHQVVLFDQMLEALHSAQPGDAVLLHGCCHNPTGADPGMEQWQDIAATLVERELLPIVDLAYHGLGDGMEQDLAATRLISSHCPQTIVAASCSKNFGLYRDRVGAVYMASQDAALAQRCQSLFGHIARRMYSMPPDHGGAVVRLILNNADLNRQWRGELDEMVARINSLRTEIATQGQHLNLHFVARQRGMFSLLPLQPQQVDSLIEDHGVYLAGDGRINIAGCQTAQVEKFIGALQAVGFNGA